MKVYYNAALKEYARILRNNMTNAEKATWRMLKGKQLKGYDFHRQKPIGNYIADFYCYDLRLVIEIDGITHLDKEVQKRDKLKENYINSIGLNILRFTDDIVLGNCNIVERQILDYIESYQKEHIT